MKTVTVSMRLPESEVKRLERLANATGLDRSTLMKQALKKGCKYLFIENACSAYQQGKVTLSRAAEMAEISIREMLLHLPEFHLELNYDAHDFNEDFKS